MGSAPIKEMKWHVHRARRGKDISISVTVGFIFTFTAIFMHTDESFIAILWTFFFFWFLNKTPFNFFTFRGSHGLIEETDPPTPPHPFSPSPPLSDSSDPLSSNCSMYLSLCAHSYLSACARRRVRASVRLVCGCSQVRSALSQTAVSLWSDTCARSQTAAGRLLCQQAARSCRSCAHAWFLTLNDFSCVLSDGSYLE